jgi:proteasome lid subunit RPN8/RPN11
MMPSGRMRVRPTAIRGCDGDIAQWPSVETGGLFGGFDDDGMLDLAVATDAEAHAIRTATSVAFDPRYNRERAAELAEQGMTVVGEWHSHPRGPGIPSRGDLRACQLMRRLRGRGRWALIISERNSDTGE